MDPNQPESGGTPPSGSVPIPTDADWLAAANAQPEGWHRPAYPGPPTDPYTTEQVGFGYGSLGGSAGLDEFAGWWQRVGAYIVDYLPSVIIGFIGGFLFGEPFASTVDPVTNQPVFEFLATPTAVVYGGSFLWFLFNTVYLQGTTGQSVGKKVAGIAVYRAGTTTVTGPLLSFGRYWAHILDALPCYLGFLWPVWDKEKRTFADMICGTRVYKV